MMYDGGGISHGKFSRELSGAPSFSHRKDMGRSPSGSHRTAPVSPARPRCRVTLAENLGGPKTFNTPSSSLSVSVAFPRNCSSFHSGTRRCAPLFSFVLYIYVYFRKNIKAEIIKIKIIRFDI
jgi:hypothetical protein